MRTVPRSGIGLMSRATLEAFLQVVTYDSGAVGPNMIPGNEGLAMDACTSQTKVGLNAGRCWEGLPAIWK